jgi:hypothetical protein
MTRKQIDQMLGILTPREETLAYRDIADEVLEKSIRDTLSMLGSLPEAAYQSRVHRLEHVLAEIRVRLEQTLKPGFTSGPAGAIALSGCS